MRSLAGGAVAQGHKPPGRLVVHDAERADGGVEEIVDEIADGPGYAVDNLVPQNLSGAGECTGGGEEVRKEGREKEKRGKCEGGR